MYNSNKQGLFRQILYYLFSEIFPAEGGGGNGAYKILVDILFIVIINIK